MGAKSAMPADRLALLRRDFGQRLARRLVKRAGPQKSAVAPLVNTPLAAMLKVLSLQGGDAEERLTGMFNVFVFAVLSGMVGLIAYEIFQEIGGSSQTLRDHYHE